MSNKLVLRPSYWANVSGGKDSLYMLYYILQNLDRYPLDGVVHFELEIDYPFIKDVVDYMEAECKKHGIRFERIKPRKSWFELYEKRNFPTRKVRWCNDKYKLLAQKQQEEYLNSKGLYSVHYIGYCVDEERRYKKRIGGGGGAKVTEVYPLVEAGIEESTILEWAKNQPIFNNYYKFNTRCGCMWCPLAKMADNAYLLKFYPDKYEQLMQMCRETEAKREKDLGRPFSVWSGNPKYNTEYRDKRVREKYLPEIERILAEIEEEKNNGL